MRLVKLIILCIVVLLCVSTALSLLFPSHLRVSRSVNIGRNGDSDLAVTRARVMRTLGDIRSWDHWESFIRSTSPEDRHYEQAGAGFRSAGLSVTVTGQGVDSVHTHWELVSGKKFEGGFYIFQLNTGDSLTVQEWMDFHFRWYPWERLGILLYDKRLGPALEESLDGLKRYVENSP